MINKTIIQYLILFTFFLIGISILIIFSKILEPRILISIEGDLWKHTEILSDFIQNKKNEYFLHGSYPNNYYIFSKFLSNFLNYFFKVEFYKLAGLSLLLLNIISYLGIVFSIYEITFFYSNSKYYSTFLICLFAFSEKIIFWTINIYPDIFCISLAFIAIYFLTVKKNYLVSIFFISLAVGTKQPAIIFLPFFLCHFFLYSKSDFKKKLYLCTKYVLIFFSVFFILNPNFYFFENLFSSLLLQKTFPLTNLENEIDYLFQIKSFFTLLKHESFLLINLFIALSLITTSVLFFKQKINFHEECILYFFFILASYIQIIYFYKNIIQGQRYFFHIYPFAVVLLSMIFNKLNLDLFIKLKKFNKKIFFSIIVLILVCLPFQKYNMLFYINSYKNSDKILAGKYFITNEKNLNSKIFSTYYSYIPKEYKKVDYFYTVQEVGEKYLFEHYDYVFLNSDRPGVFVWIDDNGEIKEKKYDDLPLYFKVYGSKNIENEKKTFISLINSKRWKVYYINPKVVILKKLNS